ncbi:MAG: CoA-binding protein [Dehalococcoidales bacterium]|nr:MAG: CoA-binding protein [Dehalococcoidales bacterium]
MVGFRTDSEPPPDEEVIGILREAKTIAVVGLSPRPERDSHMVASYLKSQGYDIIPVNPTIDEVLGQRSYPDLLSVPKKVDLVDVFRRPSEVIPVVEEAIRIRARAIWFQDGVINEKAANMARAAGLSVVMDR